MGGQGEITMHRVTSCQGRLGRRSGKEALLLTLIVAATVFIVLLAVGLQISSPRDGDGARALDVEALITTMGQSTARCTPTDE